MESELTKSELQAESASSQVALVPAAINRSLELIGDVLGAVGKPALHNFGGTPQEQWRLTAIANSPDARRVDEIGDSTIRVKYFYAHRVEIENFETHEISDVCRCVLIDDNEVPFAFVSDGIAASLGQMVAAFGLKPWQPPVPIKIVKVTTRKGFKTFRIIPV
jgi:hypothetical protein